MRSSSKMVLRTSQRPARAWHSRLLWCASAILLFALITGSTVGVGHAVAAAVRSQELSSPAIESAEAAGPGGTVEPTNPEAAEELPHEDLDRDQATALLEGVFQPTLEEAAGIFEGLEVRRRLSDTAAIVNPIEPGGGLGWDGEEGSEGSAEPSPVLLESSLPLFTTGTDGLEETVDLSLTQAGGSLQPEAPLEPVMIPGQLGEGIELPEAGVRVHLLGAPEETAPSVLGESVATYPNVATDSDLAVAPTPTGVEALTTLRGPDAPPTQTFELELPEGASLLANEEGGAEALNDGEPILRVRAPSAIDAAGAPVPVSLSVSGDAITVTASPGEEVAWPVLVDPLMEGFAWQNGATGNYAGWTPWTNNPAIVPSFGEPWAGHTGINLEAQHEYFNFGAQATWTHGVPRLAEERAQGRFPTSYITNFALQGMSMITTPGLASPFLFGGIFDPATETWGKVGAGPETVWSWPGNSPSWLQNATINFENGAPGNRDKSSKLAYGMSLAVSEAGWLNAPRLANLGAASVQIADEDAPTVSNAYASPLWVNQYGAAPITVQATDTGLGVKNVDFYVPGQGEIFVSNACGGQTQDACPRQQTFSLGSYSPAKMPQGEDWVEMRANDVLWNPTPESGKAKALVKVDHTAPAVVLTGTATEQASLGTERGVYSLIVTATDGTTTAPQSGVTKLELLIDGKSVPPVNQTCSPKNCGLSHTFELLQSNLGYGTHSLEILVTDGVGHTTPLNRSLVFTPDEVKPLLEVSGPLTTAPKGWITQKAYALEANASDHGTGVKRLAVTLDGGAVQAKQQACTLGGCPLGLSTSIDASSLSGGSHEVTVIAEDVAGNVSESHLRMNVDPNGTATVASVVRALKASEETGAPITVGIPQEEAALEGSAAGLELVANNGEYEGKNTTVPLRIPGPASGPISLRVFNTKLVGSCTGSAEQSETTRPEAELCENTPVGGEPVADELKLQPTNLGSNATAWTSTGGTSAVLSANSHPEQDTLVRPLSDGAMVDTVSRGAQAPRQVTWNLTVSEGQKLLSTDARHASLFDESEKVILGFVAEPAYDAVGHVVPTELSVVEGKKLSLEIQSPEGVVFPVVAGLGYQGGTIKAVETGPTSAGEREREVERVAREEAEIRQMEKEGRKVTHGPNLSGVYTNFAISRLGPPVVLKAGLPPAHEFEFSDCNYEEHEFPSNPGEPVDPLEPGGASDQKAEAELRAYTTVMGDCIKEYGREKLRDAERVRGFFSYVTGKEVFMNAADQEYLQCPTAGPEKPSRRHCYVKPERSTSGITAGGNFRYYSPSSFTECLTVYGHLNATSPHIVPEYPISSFAGAAHTAAPETCKWPEE
jgi:hypothetical protein